MQDDIIDEEVEEIEGMLDTIAPRAFAAAKFKVGEEEIVGMLDAETFSDLVQEDVALQRQMITIDLLEYKYISVYKYPFMSPVAKASDHNKNNLFSKYREKVYYRSTEHVIVQAAEIKRLKPINIKSIFKDENNAVTEGISTTLNTYKELYGSNI